MERITSRKSIKYFISGIPASGKTSFGNWVRDHLGFVHIDLEQRNAKSQLHEVFFHAPSLFFNELTKIHPRWICTFGYELSDIDKFNKIIHACSDINFWWFEGDLEQSQRNWMVRENRLPKSFEVNHFKNIEKYRGTLHQLYGKNILNVINESGCYVSPKEIATKIGIIDSVVMHKLNGFLGSAVQDTDMMYYGLYNKIN